MIGRDPREHCGERILGKPIDAPLAIDQDVVRTPAARSTPRCLDASGCEMPSRSTRVPTSASPSRSVSMMRLRVGSAITANASTISYNHTVI